MSWTSDKIYQVKQRRNLIVDLFNHIHMDGHIGECDKCHEEKQVILDPDTMDEGEFEYCEDCLKVKFERITKRILEEEVRTR